MKEIRYLFLTLMCSFSAFFYAFTPVDFYEYPHENGIYFIHTDREGEVSFFGYDDREIPNFDGNLVIPTTANIDGKTYDVTEIFLITALVNYADSKPLKSVYIPESIIKICDETFKDSKTIDVIWDAPNCEYADFSTGVNDLSFGPLIETIPEDFSSTYKAYNIQSVSFPATVKTIGKNAFAYCDGLTSVDIPEGITTIGESAFSYCDNLSSIDIPEGITTIGDYAFAYCDGVTSISLPESLKSFGTYIFNGCSQLESFALPSTMTYLPEGIFSNTGLKEVIIPDHITYIGSQAFTYCDDLESVTISKNVEWIAWDAFNSYQRANVKKLTWNAIECDAYNFGTLEEIIFGDDIVNIPDEICKNESKLNKITYGKNVKTIGKNAFAYCDGLTSVDIPEGITTIGDYAFTGCDNLELVTINNITPPDLGYDAFNNEETLIPHLIVPCGAGQAYADSDWAQYFDSIIEEEPFKVTLTSAQPEMGKVQLITIDCEHQQAQILAIPFEGYIFTGWSDGSKEAEHTIALTQDTALTAYFEVQKFNIRFVDWDGTLLQESDVAYNTMPSAPSSPERAATVQYTYTFKGWKPEISKALEDVTYEAQYDSVLNKYQITFVNDDDAVLCSQEWAYGEIPTCDTPSKESTDDFAFRFNGWQPEVVSVTGVATYKATYRIIPIHTLTFLDWNGDELGVVRVAEGEEANAPSEPTREGFIFREWSRDLTAVQANMYVVAIYDAIQSGTEISYKNAQDQLLSTEFVNLTLPIIQESELPNFVGWFVEAGNIEDGIVIRAHFDEDATANETVDAENQNNVRKVLRDRQVLILRGEKVYTIQGQEVR